MEKSFPLSALLPDLVDADHPWSIKVLSKRSITMRFVLSGLPILALAASSGLSVVLRAERKGRLSLLPYTAGAAVVLAVVLVVYSSRKSGRRVQAMERVGHRHLVAIQADRRLALLLDLPKGPGTKASIPRALHLFLDEVNGIQLAVLMERGVGGGKLVYVELPTSVSAVLICSPEGRIGSVEFSKASFIQSARVPRRHLVAPDPADDEDFLRRFAELCQERRSVQHEPIEPV